ncbi:MAG: PIN domain-containing protein [Bryobacteraceae bacterium]
MRSFTTAMHFVDTNVLIYSLGLSPNKEAKRVRACEILSEAEFCVSVQVLQEFYTQATRPSRVDPLSHEAATTFIDDLREYPIQGMTVAILNAALATCHRYQISYWDAAIIEAARALGCRTVFSEDMQHGQDYGGVQVIDPFR